MMPIILKNKMKEKGVSSIIIYAGGLMVLAILLIAGLKVSTQYTCGVLKDKRQSVLIEFVDMLLYTNTLEDGVVRFKMPSTYTIEINNKEISLTLSSPLCNSINNDNGRAQMKKPKSLNILSTIITGSKFCIHKKNKIMTLCLEGESCCNT